MAEKAEGLGVDILPGIAGNDVVFNDDGSVGGILTGDFGVAKDGTQKENFQAGIKINAR